MLLKIGDHFAAIRAAWRSTTSSIYEVAKACRAAEAGLSVDEKRLLLEQLPFSAATFSKYVSIAYDENLADAEVRSLLPPLFSVLYLLSTLNDAEWEAFKNEVGLRPDLKRQKVETWLKKYRGKTENLGSARNDEFLTSVVDTDTALVRAARDNPLSLVHDVPVGDEAGSSQTGITCTLKIEIVDLEVVRLLMLHSQLAAAAASYGLRVEGLPPHVVHELPEAA